MENRLIEKMIEIQAPLSEVWRVFTDPRVSKQMGGYYETDWKVGSPFGWKGQNGQLYTRGRILEFKPERLFKHNLFDLNDSSLLSVITYEFQENAGTTIISAQEEIRQEMTDDQFKEANEGWDLALQSVKKVAEKI